MILTSANYDEAIKNTKGIILIDFWAEWCGPCKMLAPVIDELEREMPDICFAKINVDEEVTAALKNNVTSIPTLMIIKDGEVVKRLVGYMSKEELKEELNKV